jgi:hypothetical protein
MRAVVVSGHGSCYCNGAPQLLVRLLLLLLLQVKRTAPGARSPHVTETGRSKAAQLTSLRSTSHKIMHCYISRVPKQQAVLQPVPACSCAATCCSRCVSACAAALGFGGQLCCP